MKQRIFFFTANRMGEYGVSIGIKEINALNP